VCVFFIEVCPSPSTSSRMCLTLALNALDPYPLCGWGAASSQLAADRLREPWGVGEPMGEGAASSEPIGCTSRGVGEPMGEGAASSQPIGCARQFIQNYS
jgi:hypothetical protein